MKINGKNVLIFPEYHLTDYPPQVPLLKQEAYDLLVEYKKHEFDILISGYVEKEEKRNFSSCLVIDGTETHNFRKSHPHKEEINFISPSSDKKSPCQLSIGQTLFIICREFSLLTSGEYQDVVDKGDIENLILISAMFHKFEENTKMCLRYCKENKIKRFITSDRFFGLNAFEVE